MKPFIFPKSDEERKRFVVPEWFRDYWRPDKASMLYWQWQVEKYLRGEPFELPEETLRMPNAELHRLMSEEFASEVLKDYPLFLSILDVGCSDGYMVKYFRDRGKNACGINDFLYPTDAIFIKENELSVLEMDMHNIEFARDSFDAIWCRHVLEHSYAPLQVLFEINRVLRREGLLFCILPPVPSVPECYPGHWHQIPEYQLRYLLEMSGFTVLSLETSFFSYERENDNLEIRAIARKKPI